ncbi:leucine-rich repeat-containing protein 15-like [Fopius arisanus]|uniref:Leucine-rich repeat-containing protein 15-like n=1 Tax=Fopius arisanus TaxID=64838 RepID=A0A9R1SYG2_9HYME|nr:PREDICTED: leucine-rich repeat-containing protein 15-like [Fopius arisanus]
MKGFPFTFVLIFISTYSLTGSNFLSCNETLTLNYEECKPANSSVLVKVHRNTQKVKYFIEDKVKLVRPTHLEFYPTGSLICTTPETITVTNTSFSDLQGVKSVHIECVQFRGFPTPFKNQNHLETLSFLYNEFTKFPQEFCADIPSIKSITLGYQQITNLSRASFFSITTHLQSLQLQHSHLKTIEPETFSRFRYLKTLELNGNELEILRPDMFDGLSVLETLNLGENIISTIKPGTFASTTSLRGLFLHSNRLEDMPKRIFCDLLDLEDLHLHRNPLKSNPSVFLTGRDNLTEYSRGIYKVGNIKKQEESFFSTLLSYTALPWLLNNLFNDNFN